MQFAANGEPEAAITVGQDHIDEALRDLVVFGGAMQQQLLGFRPIDTAV